MHRAISVTTTVFFIVANILTCYLYFYPIVHGCAFSSPSAENPTTSPNLTPNQLAPFRLLVLGDPQLEGDSSLPNAHDGYFPSLRNLSYSYKTSSRASTEETLNLVQTHLKDFLYSDLPRLLRLLRKKLDLVGNDYYLAHIYRSLYCFTYPTHVAVLGDLIGSQWVSDEEFERRGKRYWGRVFRKGKRVEHEISGGVSVTTSLGQNNGWNRRVINVAGNHDIGYAGDVSKQRLDRFERVFGQVNWETRFTLPIARSGDEKEGEEGATAAAKQPELRLLVLNSLNMDPPVLHQDAQTATYKFINDAISSSQPVGDSNSATIVLTHLPLHKEVGVCVDGPIIKYYDADKGGAVKEQNHLSHDASRGILEGIYGLSGNPNAPAGGLGRKGIILTGHDHEGCDVYHHLPKADEPSTRQWKTERYNVTTMLEHTDIPGLREITVRSMMGDFSGNGGLLSAWYDSTSDSWEFRYATCALGRQHVWWAIHIFDIVTLGLLNHVGWRLFRKSSGNAFPRIRKEKLS